jgi:hypothetical protein
MTKKQILISFIIILFLVGGFFLYKNNYVLNFKCNFKSKCIDGPVTTGPKALEDLGFKLENDYLAVKIDLPKNDYVQSQILLNYEKWKQESGITGTSTRESLMLRADSPEMKYSYVADYKVSNSTNTISYTYNIYAFTGGAHGSSYKLAFTFDEDGKLLKTEDILPQDKLKLVADLAFKEISKVSFNRLKEYGDQSMKGLTYEDYLKDKKSIKWIKEGTEAKRENYNTVWLDGNDMIIYFGQYQVWSYAEGDYELRIPIINLK